jgi:hypothetical protein
MSEQAATLPDWADGVSVDDLKEVCRFVADLTESIGPTAHLNTPEGMSGLWLAMVRKGWRRTAAAVQGADV